MESKFHGIKIAGPTELEDMDGYVLIAVRYNGEEIKQQLESAGNEKIKCVTLIELMAIFMSWAESDKNLLRGYLNE